MWSEQWTGKCVFVCFDDRNNEGRSLDDRKFDGRNFDDWKFHRPTTASKWQLLLLSR